jgi:hypothetical protein
VAKKLKPVSRVSFSSLLSKWGQLIFLALENEPDPFSAKKNKPDPFFRFQNEADPFFASALSAESQLIDQQ